MGFLRQLISLVLIFSFVETNVAMAVRTQGSGSSSGSGEVDPAAARTRLPAVGARGDAGSNNAAGVGPAFVEAEGANRSRVPTGLSDGGWSVAGSLTDAVLLDTADSPTTSTGSSPGGSTASTKSEQQEDRTGEVELPVSCGAAIQADSESAATVRAAAADGRVDLEGEGGLLKACAELLKVDMSREAFIMHVGGLVSQLRKAGAAPADPRTPLLDVMDRAVQQGPGLPPEMLEEQQAARLLEAFEGGNEYVLYKLLGKLSPKQKWLGRAFAGVAVIAMMADMAVFGREFGEFLHNVCGVSISAIDNGSYQLLIPVFFILVSVINGVPQLAELAYEFLAPYIGRDSVSSTGIFMRSMGAGAFGFLNLFYFLGDKILSRKAAHRQNDSTKPYGYEMGVFGPFCFLKYVIIGWALGKHLLPSCKCFGAEDPHSLPDSTVTFGHGLVAGLSFLERRLVTLPDPILSALMRDLSDEEGGLEAFLYKLERIQCWARELGVSEEHGLEHEEEGSKLSTMLALAAFPGALVGFKFAFMELFKGYGILSKDSSSAPGWVLSSLITPFFILLLRKGVEEFAEYKDFWSDPHSHHSRVEQRAFAWGWSGFEGTLRALTEFGLMWSVIYQGFELVGWKAALAWSFVSPFILAHVLANAQEVSEPYAETIPDWLEKRTNKGSSVEEMSRTFMLDRLGRTLRGMREAASHLEYDEMSFLKAALDKS